MAQMTIYRLFVPIPMETRTPRKTAASVNRRAAAPRTVAIALFEDMQSLDAVGPGQVFASANTLRGSEAYRVKFVAVRPGAVRTSAGFALSADALNAAPPDSIDTLIVPGGDDAGIRGAIANERLVAWLGRAARHSRRACSVCTGAFLLAATGALKGRRVATHWHSTELLQRTFPDLDVDAQAIYVNDGKFWTSAGVTAGIDMSLALVEQDLGRDLAVDVARHLVVYMHRPGHQAQFSSTLAAQSTKDDRLADLATWTERNLTKPLNVDALAARVHMSPRSFHRHMRAQLGVSPAKFVESVRLDAARGLLEEPSLDLAQIASRAGFSGPDHLIRAFERRFGVTPGAYRQMHVSRSA
jgi:transcriptional regulator GlxA family with amidase domain